MAPAARVAVGRTVVAAPVPGRGDDDPAVLARDAAEPGRALALEPVRRADVGGARALEERRARVEVVVPVLEAGGAAAVTNAGVLCLIITGGLTMLRNVYPRLYSPDSRVVSMASSLTTVYAVYQVCPKHIQLL